ncbi:MAG: tetratricopeptide repeat protein [Rikenellaceae bacterium]
MYKTTKFLTLLILCCCCCNTVEAQWLEVKNEKDDRSISIKMKDGMSSSRVIVSSSLSLKFESNMGDVTDESIGSGVVNGLNSDTIYFFMSESYKRIITVSAEGYPPVVIPLSLSPKETYRCFVFDSNKKEDEESNVNTSHWQFKMAQSFDFGNDGFQEDQIEALNWYAKAAEQGHGLAQVTLGKKYATGGDGFDKDLVKSARWFLIAAQQNYNVAQYAIANCFLQGNGVTKNLEKAYYWFQQSADKGIDIARYKMVDMLLDGYGTDTHVDNLLEWFRIYAEENFSEAQYIYGKLLLGRKSSPQNDSIAIDYINKAIELSNTEAMLFLGERYLNKDLDQYNAIKGMELFRMADGLNSDQAKGLISKYEQALSREEVFAYTMHFADEGNADDMASLAYMYYHGLGVDVDYSKAFEYYEKSSEQRTENGYVGLGLCYYYGHGVDQDYDKAYENLVIGGQNGNSIAVSMLGQCYYYGYGVDQNYDKAFDLFTKSNNNANSVALNGLGLCYCYGRGVGESIAKGFELFQESLKLDGYSAGLSLGDYYYNMSPNSKNSEAQRYYTLAAKVGNPEAQNKLGLQLFDQSVVKEFHKISKSRVDTVLIVANADIFSSTTEYFKLSGEDSYFKGGYNYAYALVSTLNNGSIVGSSQGKEAVEVLRKWAKKGYKDAMIAIASYYKYDIGIDLEEAYDWSKKAVDETTGDKSLDALYRALLGCLEFDEANALAKIANTTPNEIYARGAKNMEQAAKDGALFVYDRLHTYEKEINGDRKRAKVWDKESELLSEDQKKYPRIISLKR